MNYVFALTMIASICTIFIGIVSIAYPIKRLGIHTRNKASVVVICAIIGFFTSVALMEFRTPEEIIAEELADEAAEKAKANLAASNEACKIDRSMCQDSRQFLRYNSGVSMGRYTCKSFLERQSVYGDVAWTWTPFPNNAHHDSIETGIIKLIDADVKFPNQYGTPEKVILMCEYDIDKKSIIDISAKAY